MEFACVYLHTSSSDREILRHQWARTGCSMNEHGVIIDWGNRSDRIICSLAILILILLLNHYRFRLLSLSPSLKMNLVPQFILCFPRPLRSFGFCFRDCSVGLTFLIFQSFSRDALFSLDNLVTCHRVSAVVLLLY